MSAAAPPRPGLELQNYVLLAIFFAIVMFAGLAPSRKAASYYATASTYPARTSTPNPPKTSGVIPTTATSAAEPELKLETVFKERLEHYNDFQGKLNANLFYQLVTTVAAILLVWMRKKDFKVPFLDEVVPVHLVYYALPLVFLYLWLSFGYLFNDIVATRISLWRMAEVLEANLDAVRATDPESWKRYIYTFSLRPLLHDGAYLDGWFMTFVRQCSFNPHQSLEVMGIVRGLLVLFGIFMGITNGCMLGVVWHGSRRFATKENLGWHRAYFWILGLLLLASHAAFYWSGNRNWLQVIEIGAAFATLWFVGMYLDAEPKSESREPNLNRWLLP